MAKREKERYSQELENLLTDKAPKINARQFEEPKLNFKKQLETKSIMIKKDDLKFQRPKNAYMIYHGEYFKQFQRKYMEDSAIEISKKISQAWKVLSADKKNEYQKRYLENLANYKRRKAGHLELTLDKNIDTAVEKTLPYKRKRTDYNYFCQENARRVDQKDKFKQFRDLWLHVSAQQQMKVRKLAKIDAQRLKRDKQKHAEIINDQEELQEHEENLSIFSSESFIRH